jgi:hypothetical protein
MNKRFMRRIGGDHAKEYSAKLDKIAKYLEFTGWLAIAGNFSGSAKDSIIYCRSKDVVVKGFQALKNALSQRRIRIH